MPNFISEDQIEQALVQKLQHLHGFDALDCYTENAEDLKDGSGRTNKRDVILVDRVREAAIRLNPGIPPSAIEDALEKLCERRQAMTLVAANREIYGLLRDGIPVEFDNAQGERQQEHVRLLDFNVPDNNHYLIVTQLWIKIELMLQQNATRTDFAQRLQQIIDAYNSGGSSTENAYEELMKFTEELHAEAERCIREGLTEDELEIFDLLKKDRMTQEETQKVRLAAKSLLHRLLEEHPKVLVQDWYRDTQTRKQVRSAVEQVLDSKLPDSYDRVLFREKCDNVFYLMLDYASHHKKWAACI